MFGMNKKENERVDVKDTIDTSEATEPNPFTKQPEPAPQPEQPQEGFDGYKPENFYGIKPGAYEAELCNLILVLINRVERTEKAMLDLKGSFDEIIEGNRRAK